MKPSPLLALAHDMNVGWEEHTAEIFSTASRALVHRRRRKREKNRTFSTLSLPERVREAAVQFLARFLLHPGSVKKQEQTKFDDLRRGIKKVF